MRFRKRGFRGRRFHKRRRRVMWSTDEHLQGQEGYTTPFNAVKAFPLFTETNTFVNTRFAKINDTIALVRLLGRLRIGMYTGNEVQNFPPTDYLAHWGVCLVKGDYDDDGTWNPPADDNIPDPVQPPDQDDKWLFQDYMVLTSDQTFTAPTGDSHNYTIRNRTQQMSNDYLLPNGTWIDLSTRRTLQYGEKPMIVVRIDGDASDNIEFFVNWKLRCLITNLRQG